MINPVDRSDYLGDTVLDGLSQIKYTGGNIEFVVSSKKFSKLNFKSNYITENNFIDFSNKADIVILIWGKNNTNFKLAEKIAKWDKTIFIDGSELGKDRRLDKNINRQVKECIYKELGRVNIDMLKKCALYFRREIPYIKGIIPFPFGIQYQYYKNYKEKIKKDIDFACMFGQDKYPKLRGDIKEELEKYCIEHNLVCYTKKTRTQNKFYNILSRTKVGISVSGGGYDTARFWEILGNNCMLLTENIDIFREEDNELKYKRIYEFSNTKEFKIQLDKLRIFLKYKYNKDNLVKEYDNILIEHSSKARVLRILKEAMKKGLIENNQLYDNNIM